MNVYEVQCSASSSATKKKKGEQQEQESMREEKGSGSSCRRRPAPHSLSLPCLAFLAVHSLTHSFPVQGERMCLWLRRVNTATSSEKGRSR